MENYSFHTKSERGVFHCRKKEGTGAAMQATQELLKYAFEEFKLRKVYLNVLADNVRAKKLYEKCGFVYEGMSPDSALINGVYRALKWYGIIAKS